MHLNKKIILWSILTYLPFLVSAQYFPSKGKNWETKLPAEVGLDAAYINQAVAFAQQNEYAGSRDLRIATLESFATEPYHELAGPAGKRGGPAGMIIKNGYLINSWGDIDRVEMTFSVTKSFLSAVAGIAMDQQLIGSVNDKVSTYVWDGTYDGKHNQQITWQHLLTQSSDWSGTLFGMHDWADRPPRSGSIDEWRFRMLNTPGTVFTYNDVRVNLLSYSLLQVFRRPIPQVLKTSIMDPIGASTTWRWFGYDQSWIELDGQKLQSVSGGGHNGGGMYISTRDMARFGLLYARGGKWGQSQIISKSWIDQTIKPSEAAESYGYLWWLNKGDRKWDELDNSGIYYAAGFGGNFIVIDAKNDLVVVTRWLEPSKVGQMMKLVSQAIK